MAFTDGLMRQFLGVYHGQMPYPALLQLFAHFPCQMAHRGLINICNLQHFRTEPVAGTHGGNFRYFQLVADFCNGHFSRHIINGIDNEISMEIFDEILISRPVKHSHGFGIAGRIHPVRPFHHDFRLVAAQCGAVCHQLAVQVGIFHRIFINKNQMAYTGADQCFCRIGTDAADAENGHSLCRKKISAPISAADFICKSSALSSA